MNDQLIQFLQQLYLNLETYRKNGEAMRTPMWFTEETYVLFVRTISNSGKVKRIRNNPTVRVSPCEVDGKTTGKWVQARAHLIIDPTETARIEKLFDLKYGEAKKDFDEQRKAQGLVYATIAVEL
jgi:hypothetical protein